MSNLRFGFTTGSCSAAAAKAAAYMLLTGKEINKISIETPKGIMFDTDILDINREENVVSCCVIKDGGDDPDITTGAHVYATVTGYPYDANIADRILIDGGIGVGRVTMPGLDQPIGNAAINSVPRKMIEKEVSEVVKLCDYEGTLKIVISIPEGEELAAKTFNPRLGIVGGISVLGTSGIVEPMSSEALLKTIEVELSQKSALGYTIVPVSPGNYGLDYMKRTYGFNLDVSVKCSNFIGDTISMVNSFGFTGMLLTGHIGKLVKVAGGMLNTHSKYGDCRMEQISECAVIAGASEETLDRIQNSVVTEDAVDILIENDILSETMTEIMNRIMTNLRCICNEGLNIECMMYSNKHGMLAKSEGAEEMLRVIKEQLSEN